MVLFTTLVDLKLAMPPFCLIRSVTHSSRGADPCCRGARKGAQVLILPTQWLDKTSIDVDAGL